MSDSLLALLMLGLFPCWATAAGPKPQAIATKLQERYNGINSIEADFQQETLIRALNQRRYNSGKVFLKKPARMRWIYDKPQRQEIISDGKAIWIHLPVEKRAYRYEAEDYLSSQVAMSFLLGKGNFERDFNVSVPPETETGFHLLTLAPRAPHPQINEMTLWIDKETFNIRKILSKDHLGNTTVLSLDNQRVNKPLTKGIFSFTPPEGTEIMNKGLLRN
ncbi:MAG: outer membrane lipoprotein carrier protein LolA [Pseudomonadota bacterium]